MTPHAYDGDLSGLHNTESPPVTAMSRVFAIPELFEAILIQLSMRDLLLGQLVCTAWTRTISTSPPLQQKLFFRTISSTTFQRNDSTKKKRKTDPEFNPLLAALFPPFFSPSERNGAIEECQDFTEIYTQPWFGDEQQCAKVMREDASWRRMYPMQPARRVGRLEMWGGCYCGGKDLEVWVVREKFLARERGEEGRGSGTEDGGATMGFLFDLVVWIMDEWPDVKFWVDLGVPNSNPNASAIGSNDGVEGDDAGGGHVANYDGDNLGASVKTAGEERDGNEGERDEDESFRIIIKHSDACYSSRMDTVESCGLMIRGFEEDVIEMVEASEIT
ncbi:hypothetical protein BKA65DRAFT_518931 [Rhexocercosporidium sp. MPI-PUGE-AT-0058]|nr:hypothetical protein BKA65DRAFT_518931 [Rhexocercosporidium sp. MPI-PUGE-AT-0058]